MVLAAASVVAVAAQVGLLVTARPRRPADLALAALPTAALALLLLLAWRALPA